MRRHLAAALAVGLLLAACSSDDDEPTASPSQTVTDDASEPSSDADPTPSDTFTPRPASTPRLPEGFVPPSSQGDTDPSSDQGEGDGQEDGTSGTATSALGTWESSSVTLPGGDAFQAAPAATRGAGSGACAVAAEEGETISACASAFVWSKQANLTVVASVTADGTEATRVYVDNGAGNVSTLSAPGLATSLRTSDWPQGDNVVLATLGGDRYVLEWGAGSEATVAASLGGGSESVSFTAGRIVLRSSGEVRVLEVGAGSSSGTRVAFGASGRAPVDVALEVYRHWINGDFGQMSGLATAEVVAALREDQTTSDLFILAGTDCRASGEQATCTFRADGGFVTTWTLQRVDGAVQVVSLA